MVEYDEQSIKSEGDQQLTLDSVPVKVFFLQNYNFLTFIFFLEHFHMQIVI